jgi:hypothetical protein
MANTTDTYTLTLIDKILAPLRAIEAQASRVAETMGRIEKQTAAGLGFGAWAKKIQECVGQLSMLKDAGSGVVWIFEKMASGVWAFGKSVLSAASGGWSSASGPGEAQLEGALLRARVRAMRAKRL